MDFAVLRKDAKGIPEQYHVFFDRDDLTRLRAGETLMAEDGWRRKITVFNEGPKNLDMEAVKETRNLTLNYSGKFNSVEQFARNVLNRKRIPVRGEKEGAYLTVMPFDFPEIGADYRLKRMEDWNGC